MKSIAVFVFAITAFMNSAQAEFKWQYFGADPFAATRAEAMQKREIAFNAFAFEPGLIAEVMRETSKPGRKIRVVNDERFEGMMGGKLKLDVLVAFVKPPQCCGMEYAAHAEEWEVTWGNKIVTLVRADVCNNFLYRTRPKPVPVVTERKELKEQQTIIINNYIYPPPSTPLIAKTTPALACPDVYTFRLRVWKRPALGLPGVAQTHVKEEREQQFAKGSHVSRDHGLQLREGGIPSSTPKRFQVSFINTPESNWGPPTITAEGESEIVTVVGMHELHIAKEKIEKWDAIRVVALDDVLSPPKFRHSGVHELRFFNRLSGKKLGEWDNNPVPDCIMNVHWIE